jgi:hypothetical protein
MEVPAGSSLSVGRADWAILPLGTPSWILLERAFTDAQEQRLRISIRPEVPQPIGAML